MDQSKLDSDEACTGDTDPQKHCMVFTPGDLAARALIGKDYVDWWLANKPGEVQTIYVRFVSNKGKDYKLNGLDPFVKVIYQPAQAALPPAGGAPGAGASSPQPALTKTCAEVEGVCVSPQDELKCEGDKIPYAGKECPQNYSCYSSCENASASPAPSPSAAIKKSCGYNDGTCVNEFNRTQSGDICTIGFGRSNDYDCPPDYPSCIFGADCRAVLTPSPAAASPRPSPSPSPLPRGEGRGGLRRDEGGPAGVNQGSPDKPVAGMIYVRDNTDEQVAVQKVNVEASYVFDFFDIHVLPNDELQNNNPINLDPNKFTALQLTSRSCSIDDVRQNKEKVVRVDYIKVNTPYIASGKYQCGGSGIVNIP